MQKRWMNALVLIVFVFIGFYLYRKYKVAPSIRLETLELATLEGRDTTIAQGPGKKTVICFAASWCGPCRQELAMIADIRHTTLAGVNIVVISDESPDRIQELRQQADAGFHWLRLKSAFSTIGIYSIPSSYLVASNGSVVKKSVGYVDWNDNATAAHLLKLMDQ